MGQLRKVDKQVNSCAKTSHIQLLLTTELTPQVPHHKVFEIIVKKLTFLSMLCCINYV